MTAVASVLDLIKRHEGCRLTAYADTEGKPTIGWGHCTAGIRIGDMISQRQADFWLAFDIEVAEENAEAVYGLEAWNALDEVRRAALVDMAFQLGRKGLAGFIHMLTALSVGDWKGAARHALDSEWAKQTPNRAREIATMYETGAWPV